VPNEQARSILAEARDAGFTISAASDGTVRVRPAGLPTELREKIREAKEDLLTYLRTHPRPSEPDSDFLTGLRRFAPALWQTARMDGGLVLVWGVTSHGVVVSPGPGMALLTVDPADLEYPAGG